MPMTPRMPGLRQRATLLVRGNHDHAVGYDVDPRCSPPFREMAEATRQHALKTLSEEDKHFLRDLPLTASVERDRRRFFLCHATPSDPLFAYCPPDSRAWVDEIAAHVARMDPCTSCAPVACDQ